MTHELYKQQIAEILSTAEDGLTSLWENIDTNPDVSPELTTIQDRVEEFHNIVKALNALNLQAP